MSKRILIIALGAAAVAFLLYLGATGRQIMPPLVSSANGQDAQQLQPDSEASISAEPSATPLPVQHANMSPVVSGQPVADHSQVEGAPVSVPPQPHTPPALEPEIRQALGKILNTSSEGLVEETRDGVTKVDLQRRFQTAPVATLDEQGNVQITDYTHLPPEPVETVPP